MFTVKAYLCVGLIIKIAKPLAFARIVSDSGNEQYTSLNRVVNNLVLRHAHYTVLALAAKFKARFDMEHTSCTNAVCVRTCAGASACVRAGIWVCE